MYIQGNSGYLGGGDSNLRFVRCGMSGEPAPRCIIRSEITMKPYGQVCSMARYVIRRVECVQEVIEAEVLSWPFQYLTPLY